MTLVVLALGSNIGARIENLRVAVRRLEDAGVTTTATSGVWETAPIPDDQPRFLNAVVAGETDLDPHELLALAKRIEHALGRRPSRRWGPRPLDIDVLFYGDHIVATPALTVPHPLIASRAFVLAPLAEVMHGSLPVLGERALDLLAMTDTSGMHRTGGSLR